MRQQGPGDTPTTVPEASPGHPALKDLDTRSLFSAVRIIFTRTMQSGGSAEELTDHFLGRLDALARCATNPALGHARRGVDLEQLVREELRVFQFGDDPRFTIAGGDIALGGDAALWVGLAVHELATNAIKFGTLGNGRSEGRLSICWEAGVEGLTISWRETGISVVSPAPLRRGFGRMFLEEMMPGQLGGDCTFNLHAGELFCVITLPRNTLT